MSINRKQKQFILFGITCGLVFAALIEFFPEAVDTNPVLKALAILLLLPASIVSFWFLTEIFKSSSGR